MAREDVITRFPPSPSGNLHIGGARTALFNFLFTRRYGGKIYLRLEDTDEERSKPEYEKNVLESLKWLGLTFDPVEKREVCAGNHENGEPFWRQSERKDIYRSYLKKLVESGGAYLSKETVSDSSFSKGDALTKIGAENSKNKAAQIPRTPFKKGKTREEVIRFKNPNKKIAFDDLIRGHIEFDTAELGDTVIAKSLDEPLYHFAAVIDDYEMGITHVIRGEDHISNTPRQILLQQALGFPHPSYAHIPLILAPDRSKLSKRHGAVSVTEYRDRGYFPEAFLNYLALLGWNPGTEREIFSLGELAEIFDLSKVQKGGAIFSEEKLRWFNKEYLKNFGGADALKAHIPEELTRDKSQTQITALAEMLFERISVFGDIEADIKKGEFAYLLQRPVFEPALLSWKKETNEEVKKHLGAVGEILEKNAGEKFTKEEIKSALMPYAESAGKGSVLWPFRVALSGQERSPDPFTLTAILGKEEVVARVKAALAVLK